ncbi:EF-P lysine aminoacylase EpmA [Pseudoxanthomonas sacheonensis]|uniref:Lysyl-tRNA synthetase class 2 n=1 Tax=Pseudoxanthomonas sacheonensis TaxID=443615 RepID=A0ABU1RS07_9GAMM|nr:EF-P lysine aminoacylase EpmA [Pseudoxanthomonas sacheonensis]MDR6840889.1 lysyl-tRNA synthetase class 2 [Pseudoxanthomonas sacheonensis]
MTQRKQRATPPANLDALRLRAAVNALFRLYFAERDVLEVETPILSEAGNTEPNIESFTTHFTGHSEAGARTRWMRTSPEYPLKRLLAAGVGDCYELGRVFRNGEAGGRHNPEFTMLEWYRVGWDHLQLIEETVQLVQRALGLIRREAEVVSCTYLELFQQGLGLNPFTASDQQLRAPLSAHSIDAEGLTRDDWLDLLITHLLQPAFPADRITVVRDWPASQCALARIRPGDPPLAERFELYLGSHELANGYHELTDATEQRLRFMRDLSVRESRIASLPPVDERLLDAMAGGLPACAGVALGVDRLLMAMMGTDRIADVLAFRFREA